jgi:hypothetical protein
MASVAAAMLRTGAAVIQRIELTGKPVRGILGAAEAEGTDVVVLPTHGAEAALGEASLAEALSKAGPFRIELVDVKRKEREED